MIKKDINQNDILNLELLDNMDYNYVFDNKPINRINLTQPTEDYLSKLKTLKDKIEKIEDWKLKKKILKLFLAKVFHKVQ